MTVGAFQSFSEPTYPSDPQTPLPHGALALISIRYSIEHSQSPRRANKRPLHHWPEGLSSRRNLETTPRRTCSTNSCRRCRCQVERVSCAVVRAAAGQQLLRRRCRVDLPLPPPQEGAILSRSREAGAATLVFHARATDITHSAHSGFSGFALGDPILPNCSCYTAVKPCPLSGNVLQRRHNQENEHRGTGLAVLVVVVVLLAS